LTNYEAIYGTPVTGQVVWTRCKTVDLLTGVTGPYTVVKTTVA
jgi:hypothetical protein